MAKANKKSKLYEWQVRAREGGICVKCGRLLPILSVDHIVPLAIMDMLDDTGLMKYEYDYNFQLLCYPCNRFKGGKLDKTNPKTIEILKKLLTD